MILSRRLVLGGLVGLGAGALVKTRAALPVLWGDMIHDDSPALNALFRGDPIRVIKGAALEGETPSLLRAACLLRSTVRVPTGSFITFKDVHLRAADDGFEGDHMVHFEGGATVHWTNGLVENFKGKGAALMFSSLEASPGFTQMRSVSAEQQGGVRWHGQAASLRDLDGWGIG